MTHATIFSSSSCLDERIIWPMPPAPDRIRPSEIDLYVRFMRHVRAAIITRPEMRVLSALQFVADVTGLEDSEVALQLVEMGLRAPRAAFPASFLAALDPIGHQAVFGGGAIGAGVADLLAHWKLIGEGGGGSGFGSACLSEASAQREEA